MASEENHNPQQTKEKLFERMLKNSNPKSRYASETHVQDETNNIAHQILSGETKIQRKHKEDAETEHERLLKKRLKRHIQNQKRRLQSKLGQIQKSLTSLNDISQSATLHESKKITEERSHKIQKQRQQILQIKVKKQQIAQKKKEKLKEMFEMQSKIKEQEIQKRKKQIQKHILEIKERNEHRDSTIKSSNEALKEVFHRKELYDRFTQSFKERQNSYLEERKRKLAEIRMLHQPISSLEIQEHEQKFLQQKKQRNEMRSRQKLLGESRKQTYKPSYESAFYKKAAESQEIDLNASKIKLEKIKQFNEHVKEKFIPSIDQKKKREIQEQIEREQELKKRKEQRDKQLLQKPKLKGLEYLSLLRNMPKKKQVSKDTAQISPKTQRIRYKNYLGTDYQNQKAIKPWKTILKSKGNKIETAQLLQIQSQKVEQKLKRKQLQAKVLKVKDDGSIDQQYYQMVKAKLDLLALQ